MRHQISWWIDRKDGQKKIVGVFEERAMQLIRKSHQDYLATLDQSKLDEIWYDAIDKSVENCLQYGVTSFQDAGSRMEELKKYEEMAKMANWV
ncbi:MAG: hypothetical protein IPN72_22595 [Saprospiraceae bacterium]|nr:hypothetical protein [Saprospiraceae bacterium]